MHGGKGMVDAVIRAVFLDDIFQGIRHSQCGYPGQSALFQDLPVLFDQNSSQAGYGKKDSSYIS